MDKNVCYIELPLCSLLGYLKSVLKNVVQMYFIHVHDFKIMFKEWDFTLIFQIIGYDIFDG